MIRVLCAGIGLLLASAQIAAADSHLKTIVEEVLRSQTTAAGQPIELPPEPLEVIASVYTIPPGAKLAVHKHPYPRYAYVLSGTLHVTAAKSGQVVTYDAGDFIVEMVEEWHWGSNPGSEPVRLLVIDQAQPGRPNTILRPD